MASPSPLLLASQVLCEFDLFGTLGEQLPILLLVVRDMILACLRKTCWLFPLAHFGEMLSFRISH